MTPVLPELPKLPTGHVLDGELVAWKGEVLWFPHVSSADEPSGGRICVGTADAVREYARTGQKRLYG